MTAKHLILTSIDVYYQKENFCWAHIHFNKLEICEQIFEH